MLKKICFIIGSRANYSSIKSVMDEIKKDKNFKLSLILTTSSILQRYGEVSKIINKDGFKINEKIFNLIEGENPLTMAKSTGLGLVELSTIFERIKPNLVFSVGDRFETMATVLAASYMNIPLAHTMGGEVTGTIDESIRHAVTKLSHLHFPATKKSYDRIIKLGEEKKNIFLVGCPRVDYVKQVISKTKNLTRKIENLGVGRKIDFNKEFIILSYHPVTTEFSTIEKNFRIVLEVIEKSQVPSIILWPNSDAGSSIISKVIRKYRERKKLQNARFYKNVPTDIYIELLNKASCIIGNSSSGIREGAFIGVPCINIGTRQNSRERGKNVIDVNYNEDEIKVALEKQLKKKKYPRDVLYGDGSAGRKIVKILKTIKKIKIQKKITY
tara:strand:+ start:99 stop:1253 length:1155 start_codon:yes stop_codon:yes gene_type:complete